ncbi:MAG: ribosome recycling factor [Elusimicrobia bacterium RIFCSPLOWO2_01_FULL_59_12]|nr:MAG: ribosome recycling factor [Elusimicrobia bacterium RIFCSPLOWO2_01_FULL_59_12]
MVPKALIAQAEEQMKKTLDRMRGDLGTLRTGRASTTLLENVRVEYYGASTPLNQLAAMAAPEPRMLEIRPWDKGSVAEIEKAILKSDLGLTPNNDGNVIRLQIPQLTEDRRKDLIKVVRKMAEEYRVALRNERRDAVERMKKAEKSKEISEDDRSTGEQEIQKLTDLYAKRVDDLLAGKERDIMEV